MLLSLLQFVSPSLPLGAFNYSEGLEFSIENQHIASKQNLQEWLNFELKNGTIRVDVAVILRIREALLREDLQQLQNWNQWLQGMRESKELRQQSLQMGQSLLKLLEDLDLEKKSRIAQYQTLLNHQCHYAIAFGIAITLFEIDPKQAVLGYLHSWVSNQVNAGVKLIPLGQTAGQQIIFDLHPAIAAVTEELMKQKEEHLYACTWGLSLASMNHEIQYTRLFRS